MRFALLALGAALTAAMAVFAFTPLAWVLAGRPAESYPEILFCFIGLPLALVVLAAGGLAAKRAPPPGRGVLVALRVVAGLATAGSALLLSALLPWSLPPWSLPDDGLPQLLLNAVCLATPILVIALAVIAALVFGRRRRGVL